jgi:hypothetical protein
MWWVTANQYREVVEGWIEQGRTAGYQISFDHQRLFGFPNHITLRFDNLRWKNNDAITFTADHMDLSARPWKWEIYNAHLKGHAAIEMPADDAGHSLVLSGDNGRAIVTLDRQGVWLLSTVSLDNAAFGRSPDYLFRVSHFQATAQRPPHPPENHTEPGLLLTSEATTVALPSAMPSPFGPTMAALAVKLRVMGSVPDFRRKDSLSAWNKDMGVVEFDELHMAWGALNLWAKGTMGFDDDLQPEGAFSSTIDGHQDAFKALLELGFIPKRQENMLNSALTLLARPAAGDHPGIEAPIAVQLGGLFFGPIRIFSFPMIEWPN